MLVNHMTWEEICDHIIKLSNYDAKGFKAWLMTKEYLGVKFDPMMYSLAFRIYKKIHEQDSDFFITVTGREGKGKTTFLMNFLALIDPELNLKKICFKPLQFIEAVEIGKKSCIHLDEGNLILFSREAMSGGNKDMVKILALMRQRNLCVGICVPNFWTLDTYMREHRVNCVIDITARGHYTGYIDKAIQLLSKYGKETKSCSSVVCPYGTFWKGTFNDGIPNINDINKESYMKHKTDTFDSFIADLKVAYQEKTDSKSIRASEAQKILAMSASGITKWIKEGKLPAKKVGRLWMIPRDYVEKLGNVSAE